MGLFALNEIKLKLFIKNIKVTPYELWFKSKPNIAHMRPFGADAFDLIPASKRAKFDAKAEKGILVGYQEGTYKNYRICNQSKDKVFVARNVQ